jgi:hypothetical protein
MTVIRALEDKYGLLLFGMGFTHLVDVGVRNLTDEAVHESIRQIMADGDANNTNEATNRFISPKCKCAIVQCAADLSKHSIWDLFRYIKFHVNITN